jgi:hypothetical protein
MKKLPIGIQSFEKLRTDNFIYVDKTEYIYELTKENGYYFISRPRRFGKSLLVDTIKCLFEGKKELFEGLFIYDKWNWEEKYPVIRIDFSIDRVSNKEELNGLVNYLIDDYAKLYNVEVSGYSVNQKFRELIIQLNEKYKNKVVVLVDEYDKPILDNIDKDNVLEIRDALRDVYGILKPMDNYLKFVLLTGVSKFSKVSIFSGLNNLNDITIDDNFSGICGYKEEDLDKYFGEYLDGVDRELLRLWYNGYSWGGDRVYNPFDILLFFSKRNDFRPYWFETGTPTFLIKLLMSKKFFIPDIEHIEANDTILSSFEIERISPVTLLFQTGYLTIKEIIHQSEKRIYILSYPNKEVRVALNDYILKDYVNDDSSEQVSISNRIYRSMRDGNIEVAVKEFQRLFSGIPYQWYVNNRLNEYEGFYSSIFYSVFNSLGLECIAEDIINRGRIDLTIKIDNYLYIFEFKVIEEIDDSKKPLEQIKERRYFEKYQQENKEIILVGIEFSKEKRNIKEYAFEKISLNNKT